MRLRINKTLAQVRGISIHAPLCGVRPARWEDMAAIMGISIHAPLCGVRHGCTIIINSQRHFNPRTPVRGATADGITEAILDIAISIHAPLCGVRRRWTTTAARILLTFQSTHPCAGCDCKHAQFGLPKFLQLHQIGCMLTSSIHVTQGKFNRKCGFRPFFAVRSAPEKHVCFRFTPRQSISSPSGA